MVGKSLKKSITFFTLFLFSLFCLFLSLAGQRVELRSDGKGVSVVSTEAPWIDYNRGFQ